MELYKELREFNLELVDSIERHLTSLDADANGRESEDLVLARAHLERIVTRLRFWSQRRLEIDRED